METLGWDVYAIGAGAALFAGVSKGGFGSGAAFAGAAILALWVAPGLALGIMLPLLLLTDAVLIRPYWRQWDWRCARVLLAGGVPGVALGALLYGVADPDLFRLLIGAVCLIFVALRLWPRLPRPEHAPRWLGAGMGVLAGFTSFISHAGGPAVAVYLLGANLRKTEYQATTVLVFALLNVVKALPYGVQGLFSAQSLWLSLTLSPFALIGAGLGVMAHRRIPERWFFGITYVLLTVTGLRLIQVAVS